MAKVRGKLLTTLLIIWAAWTLYNIFNSVPQLIFGNYPLWQLIWLILESIAFLLSLWGVWIWKKWGAYLFITSLLFFTVFSTIYRFTTGNAQILEPNEPSTIIYQVIGLIIGIALMVGSMTLYLWAIYRKWKYFT